MKATEILKYYVDNNELTEFCFKPLSADVIQNDFFKLTFSFANNDEGEIVLMASGKPCPNGTSSELLQAIIKGKVDVTSTPFIPKVGDHYMYFETWDEISEDIWENLPFEIAMFKCGMIFRNKKEALKARDELMEKYGTIEEQ